ncbi:MAG: 4-alpha-glucanotransferase [Planctomycetaceae bacterium]|nr:4-alpha-glucanotransferase [Planctomycetaceae bacterium]
MDISPFPEDYRGSGLLLHVTSLPTRYGIGDFGPAALTWIDRLAASGQKVWQVLPLGPMGAGNSPYQLVSTFAGNEFLISPDDLIKDGLLLPSECEGCSFPAEQVDYEAVKRFKNELHEQAWQRFLTSAPAGLRDAFERFCRDEAGWLDEYALFVSLQQWLGRESFLEWPDVFAKRDPGALADARRELAERTDRVRFGQFLVFRQMTQMRTYANSKGVQLIGDMPCFAAPNSCDVWANPEFFLLDPYFRPTVVAGVPPDYFSPDGQLWGNPIYHWEAMREDGYRWWIRRFRTLLQSVDVVRLDHFRAFAAAWHIPATAETAMVGEWLPGPGAEFFETIRQGFGGLPFLAEDLGMITPDVTALKDQFQLTGMRVLQFAFDGDADNPFLPQNFDHNTVAYTATHDNNTTRGWYEEMSQKHRNLVWRGLNQAELKATAVAPEMIRHVWASNAALAVTPFQDVINLGAESRMNTPGKAEGNWGWRCTAEMLEPANFVRLRALTSATGRC